MAELHDLSPTEGSRKNRKRVGRGAGSGWGKNAGRGEKGQKSRSGGSIRIGFEGGQMPLQRRIPKRGFTPLKRRVYHVVNVGDLVRIEGTTVNPSVLKEAGLIRSTNGLVKILGTGDVGKAFSIEAHAFSAGAKKKIEAAGGTVSVIIKSAVQESEPVDVDVVEDDAGEEEE
jgi:large subunit ribosomal protein L15